MTLIKCPECGHEMSDEAAFCPYCGKPNENRHLSTSFASQAKVYLISLFLPPFGLWYVWQYLRQKDKKSKKIGGVSLVLTIISIFVTILTLNRFINSANQIINSNNLYGL